MTKIISKTQTKVAFCDLDPMNIVWHGNYLKYLEAGRSEVFDKLGFGYKTMKEYHTAYPIAKMDLKFIAPAELDQVLEIEVILKEIEPAVIIDYTIRDFETGKKLFKAKSMQIRIDTVSKETIYTAPEQMKRVFEQC